MFAIKDRAETLSYESKTSTFASSAEKSLNILKEMGSHDLAGLDTGALQTVNGSVAGAVVEITPTDAEHINPTFAFCKALGLEGQRVQRSIGDGCFRTLKQFFEDPHVRLRLRETEHEVGLIPRAQRLNKKAETDRCPYFTINGAHFRCPFTQTSRHTNVEARSVYEICRRDVAHQCAEA
jgi:hypothetical protein